MLPDARRGDDQSLFATVSGSFRRSMGGVQEAVFALTDAGVRVLSPSDPRIVAQLGDFLFVASDYLRAVKPVQSRHLAAIAVSDFLWVVAPDGYVGLSVAMEIGYAVASGTPIYSAETPADVTLREYVEVLDGPEAAVARTRETNREVEPRAILLDPVGVAEAAHSDLDLLVHELTTPGSDGTGLGELARRIEREIIAPLR